MFSAAQFLSQPQPATGELFLVGHVSTRAVSKVDQQDLPKIDILVAIVPKDFSQLIISVKQTNGFAGFEKTIAQVVAMKEIAHGSEPIRQIFCRCRSPEG